MIMIVKTSGSQMGSPAAAEGGGGVRGGGGGESGERSEVQARSTLTSTALKARSRSREVATLDEAPRISQRVSSKITSLASSSLSLVITADISMPVCQCNSDICAYIGFLVDTVKARGGTTSRGTRRGAAIRCLTLRRQVVTTAQRRRGRSRVNRTGNDACSHARTQRRITTPPDCTCTKAIDNIAANRTTGSRRACRRVSPLTRMRDVNSAADETISR